MNRIDFLQDTYLIMRKRKDLQPDNPFFYVSNNNPNLSLIREGVKVLIEKEWFGEICFNGCAVISKIERNPRPVLNQGGQYIVRLDDYVRFFPPRVKDPNISRKLNQIEGYNWVDSIREIPRELFLEIVEFCKNDIIEVYRERTLNEYNADSIRYLISEEESTRVEFKSSLGTPTKVNQDIYELESSLNNCEDHIEIEKIQSEINRLKKKEKLSLENATLKTIAAFSNTLGGILVIGVDDNRTTIHGIEQDYDSLHERKNWDGWNSYLDQLIYNRLGSDMYRNVKVIKGEIEGKTIARIDVLMSDYPVWLTFKEDGITKKVFYIRGLNLSRPLDEDSTNKYINSRWSLVDEDNQVSNGD